MRVQTYLRDGEPGADGGGGTDDGGQQDSGANDMIPRSEYEALKRRHDAMAANKKKLEDTQAAEAARKADAQKALDQKALEEAREYEKLKAQHQAEAEAARKEADSVRAEYETRFMVLKDGVVNDRVVNLFMSDLLACETSEERVAKWAEIKADPENAIFFAPAQQQQEQQQPKPPQAPPPGTPGAGRSNPVDWKQNTANKRNEDPKVRKAARDAELAYYKQHNKWPDE